MIFLERKRWILTLKMGYTFLQDIMFNYTFFWSYNLKLQRMYFTAARGRSQITFTIS